MLLRARPRPGDASLRPALNAAAFHDLLAELHAQLVLGNPGDRAKAQRGFAIKAQPEQGRQVLWMRKINEGSVLRYVAHCTAHVFGLERVKNRSLHKCIAPWGTALFCELMVILHRLTQPHNCHGGKPTPEA